MIAPLMIYGVLIAALLALAALTIEQSFVMLGWPRRGIWAAMLVSSLALPIGMVAMRHPSPAPHMWVNHSPASESTAMLAAIDPPRSISVQLESPLQRSWRALPELDVFLKGIWFAGSLGMLVLYAVGWTKIRRVARQWPRERIDGVMVAVSDRLGPAVAGFVNPTIVIPRWLLRAPAATRAMAMAHERAHVSARDPLLVIGALLVVAVAPWNLPLLWQLRRLRFAIEVDCDARVLRGGADPFAYGKMLLAISQNHALTPLGSIALTEPASQLERRIRIMTAGAYRHGRALIAASLVLSASLVAAAAQLNAPALSASIFATATAGNYRSISFQGQTYDFYKIQKITNGRGVYFAPNGQNPDQADEAIIVNYFDPADSQGNVISAKAVAERMVQQLKARGATVVASFGASEPLNKSQSAFFTSSYYVYPQDGNGDIWISKVAQAGNRVVGLLYKHQIYGADSATIKANTKNWFAQNLETYGPALDALVAPAEPSGGK